MNAFIEVERGLGGLQEGRCGRGREPRQRACRLRGRAPDSSSAAGANRPRPDSAASRPTRTSPAELKEQVTRHTSPRSTSTPGRFDEAAQRLDTLIATAKDPALRQRAELRRADVEIARGRKDLATWRLKEFLKAHPDSPLAAEAQALLDALQGKGPAARPAPKES